MQEISTKLLCIEMLADIVQAEPIKKIKSNSRFQEEPFLDHNHIFPEFEYGFRKHRILYNKTNAR